ncbi:MAG: hypothetical protein CSA50_04455 [Gammaproteobacteria bacterium]|nr:MAG: hypothetical protein CSA50_04455 [Gammaproteobacteria bacterium]
MSNFLASHSSPLAEISSNEEMCTTCLEIGQSAPTKIIPILAIVTFIFGILAGVLLPSIVQEEDMQIRAQSAVAQPQEGASVQN